MPNRDTIININSNNIDIESDTSTNPSTVSKLKSVFSKIVNSGICEKLLYFVAFVLGGGITTSMLFPMFKHAN